MSWFRRARLPRTPLDAARWVVLDCETSGPDPGRARLLSVGAIAVRGGRVQVGEWFGALVRQAQPSGRENIVVHGIGGEAQLGGRPLDEVIGGLERFLAGDVAVAFHAGFDGEILRRHGLERRPRWLDLAVLAPALFPGQRVQESTLDRWLEIFSIPGEARHDALGDAFAAAQLLLVLLAEAKRQRVATVEDVLQTERAGRWLARR